MLILEKKDKSGRLQKLKPHLFALGLYTALTVIVAWPVIINMSVGTPGHFPTDQGQFLWNFWWFKYSLLEKHTNPFVTGYLYYPYGTSLYLHTFSLYNMLLGLPLQLLFGVFPAYAILALLTFPLAGYGAYLLARYLLAGRTGSEAGALLAGILWSFGPYHFVMLRQDWLNLVSLQWIPFFVLFLIKLTRGKFWPNGGWVALFFFLILLTDYYYTAFLILFGGLYWFWQVGSLVLDEKLEKVQLFRQIRLLTLKYAGAYGLALLPFSPLLVKTLAEIGSGKYRSDVQAETSNTHSVDLVQLFLPPAHNPWIGSKMSLWQNLGVDHLNNWGIVLSYVPLVLGILALVKMRGLGFWLFNAVLWLLPALGPQLRINNNTINFPLPYNFLKTTSVFAFIRFPERYLLMTQFSLAVLSAYGLADLVEKVHFRQIPAKVAQAGLATLIIAAAFLEGWPGILPPPDPVTQPPFTVAIAAKNSNSGVAPEKAILELPITKHGPEDTPRMLYATYHERPIVGGYTSREPPDPYRGGEDFELANWVQLDLAQADIVPPPGQAQLLGMLNNANIGFVVVYPADFKDANWLYQRAKDMTAVAFGGSVNAQPKPYYQDSQATVYRVPPATLSEPVLVVGNGWNTAEVVDGNKKIYQRWLDEKAEDGRIIIVAGAGVDLNREYTLEVPVNVPDKPRHLQVSFNGQALEDKTLPNGVNTLSFKVKLHKGNNLLVIRPDAADGFFQPSKAGGAPGDNRKLRFSLLNIKLS